MFGLFILSFEANDMILHIVYCLLNLLKGVGILFNVISVIVHLLTRA